MNSRSRPMSVSSPSCAAPEQWSREATGKSKKAKVIKWASSAGRLCESVRLVVRFSAMSNGSDINAPVRIIDSVHHPVIPNANSPQVLLSAEFSAALRPWLSREAFNLG